MKMEMKKNTQKNQKKNMMRERTGTGMGANGGNESRIALHFVWPELILIYGRKFAPFAPTLETPLLGVFIQMFSERSSRIPRPAQPPMCVCACVCPWHRHL